MSEGRPGEIRRATRGVLRAALLCAFAVLSVGVARGQDALRGEVAEDDINRDLLASPSLTTRRMPLDDQPAETPPEQEGVPAPLSRPADERALQEENPEEAEAARQRSLFDENVEETVPIGRPRTAQQREQARREAAEPALSTAERIAAERARRAGEDVEDAVETTGTVREGTIDSETELRTEAESQREEAIEGLEIDEEENPYAPLGLRIGTFTVLPSAETGVTWTSNANSSFEGSPATLSETTLRLNAISEWGGDRTAIDAFGNFRKTIAGEEIDETRAGIRADLERDLEGDWRALASLGYEVGPESASSPTAVVGTLEQPIKHTFEGSAGLQKDVGQLQLRLTGNVEREVFGDAELSTGGTISQADQNNTLATVVLRTGYEVSPALTPFIELEYGHRSYDEEFDSNGFARSSTRTGARGGVEIDLGEKFLGEVSAGWINEELEDDRLAPINGPTFAASLDWSPVRGTIVGLDAETIVEGATSPGESGSILHQGRVLVSREMRANLTAELGFGGGLRDYTGVDGQDTIWNAEAAATWWLNRYVGLTGRVRHEELKSDLPNRDYETNSVFVGLKLQR